MPDPIPTESARERLTVSGPLALAAVTLGLLTWPIAFNLGACGEIFYVNIFQVVVAASILFVITTVNGGYGAPWKWLIRIALAAPLFWLLAAAFLTGSTSEAMDQPIFVVSLILILLISVPLTLRLFVDMSMPNSPRPVVGETPHRSWPWLLSSVPSASSLDANTLGS